MHRESPVDLRESRSYEKMMVESTQMESESSLAAPARHRSERVEEEP
jgi:hypothetical protein